MAKDNMKSICITSTDMERLESLLDFVRPTNEIDLANLERLEEELCRANIVEPEDIPLNVVTINSKVWLREIDSDREITFILVFPLEASRSEHKISILAPIGSAVIGRQIGDIIKWKAPGGIKRAIIRKMLCWSEISGEFRL